jgi:hypothetical protein
MKYETPNLAAVTPAINAIQGMGPASEKLHTPVEDGIEREVAAAYQDWE